MLTKIGVAALLGTIGTAVVGGGTAKADEYRRVPVAPPVTIAAPVAPVAWTNNSYDRFGDRDGYGRPGVYYRNDRREQLERMRREQREQAMRHAEWLRHHGGFTGRR
jgi:hypothetical protein